MPAGNDRLLARVIAASARPLAGAPTDFDPILNAVGDARFVLIGEASHGTHEFYRIRAEITKRLIREKGFNAVAVEADWPDAYRVNRFVLGRGEDADATEALGGFKRFPQWMWRNADVLDFIGWLRSHNDAQAGADHQVGFYGLDLYSINASMRAVLAYLHTVDPEAAARAEARYGCFDHAAVDPQEYGYGVSLGTTRQCEDEAVRQLLELHEATQEYARRDGRVDPDAAFAAEQNAHVVLRAEQYYRAMFQDRQTSWNVRDIHMSETLHALDSHVGERTGKARIVVWAHNSHLGDARETEMGERGELNLGQLTREDYGDATRLIGFSTFAGTVTAASDWDRPAERKRVQPALADSYEALFHTAGPGNLLLDFTHPSDAQTLLAAPRLQRAIGVIYRPETERLSHYYHVKLPRQFDLVLHYDTTRAVEPIERTQLWERGEGARDVPETFPSAL